MISITKKHVTVNLDEELLEKAKKQIPNISGFIEECLKNYLGEGRNLIGTGRQQELIRTISKCQLELYMLNKKENIEEEMKNAAEEEIQMAWRRVYASYRDTRKINQTLLENAEKVLGVSAEELRDIIEVAYVYNRDSDIDITDWYEVYEEYGYGDKSN